MPTLTNRRSSPPVAVAVSVTVAPPPIWQAPSLQEFLADIERRRSQPALYECHDMFAVTNFWEETGQEEGPVE